MGGGLARWESGSLETPEGPLPAEKHLLTCKKAATRALRPCRYPQANILNRGIPPIPVGRRAGGQRQILAGVVMIARAMIGAVA